MTWVPTRVDTVTLSLLRDIEDSSAEGIVAYTYTTGRLAIDHEYRRNILLSAYVQGQHADYQTNPVRGVEAALLGATGQSETIYSIGASATWRLNWAVSLTAGANFTSICGGGVNATNAAGIIGGGTSSNISEGLALLTLSFAL